MYRSCALPTCLFHTILLLMALPAMASDSLREQRWADEIVEMVLVGEPQWLEADGHRFLSIWTGAEGEQQGAVILVHGVGVHPDWPDVINPLREQLPASGWATLSLQMPVLDAEAEVTEYFPIFDEVPPRIDAGVRFLQDQGIDDIVILGHSLGSQMAAFWISRARVPQLKGFVAVGMSGARREGHGDTVAYLEKITVPVLDLYGESDLRTVKKTTDARAAAAARAGNIRYQLVEVDGADHMFRGSEEQLVELVSGWLQELAREAGDTD